MILLGVCSLPFWFEGAFLLFIARTFSSMIGLIVLLSGGDVIIQNIKKINALKNNGVNLKKYEDNYFYYIRNSLSNKKYHELVKICNLNKEEINELFQMKLNKQQLEFLKMCIETNQQVTMSNLLSIANLLTEEEKEELRKEEALYKENQKLEMFQSFIHKNELEKNELALSLITINNDIEPEKEINALKERL